MPKHKITINKLKGINKLQFEFPERGVHLISATNGSGKTTLLVCMERIVNTSAFSENFTQHVAYNLDSYNDASIEYTNKNGQSVTYTYRGDSNSWRPTTRVKNVLENAFASIQYMPTLDKRIFVQRNRISKGTIRAASAAMRNAMAEVLANDKFKELLKINIGETRGRGGADRRENTAFILPLGRKRDPFGGRTNYYYSESSFSLGEIFVLNLLFRIQHIPEGSMLLIDELEVALHPKIQEKLLRYIERVAEERNLLVIVSTHSSSLIKSAKNLIYLENDGDGNILTHYNCYPTYALREVAILDDINPDYVFFVEDVMARKLLTLMIKRYFNEYPNRIQAIWKVLPVGGYGEVLRFLKNCHHYLLSRSIGQYAFLDNDVTINRDELRLKGNNRSPKEEREWTLFNELNDRTHYLHITPEVGLIEFLINNKAKINSFLIENYPDYTVDVDKLFLDCMNNFPHVCANPRDDAKHKLAWISNELSNFLNINTDRIYDELFTVYIIDLYSDAQKLNELKQLFGPIFNLRGNR